MEKYFRVYRHPSPTDYTYNGGETFFYGYGGSSSSESSKLKKLSDRFGKESSNGGLRGKDKTGSGIKLNDLSASFKQLDKTLRVASEVGISYSEMLDLDIRKFNMYVEGYVLRRQQHINDTLMINHLTAGKIAEAVWGSRNYKKPFKTIELLKDSSVEAANREVIEFLKKKGVL